MNLEYWSGRVGGALLLLSLFLAVRCVASPAGPLRGHIDQYVGRMRKDLGFVHATWTVRQVVSLQACALVVLIASVFTGQWTLAGSASTVAAAPLLLLRSLRHKRVTTIDQQVEAWLVAMSNALKASPSLGDALVSTISLVRDPIASEIDHLVKEYQLGSPLDQAFHSAAVRVGSRPFSLALTTLRIARNTGGNLPDTLATSATSLREMARLDGVVRTKTAEGKAQALVISAIPLPMYFMIQWIQPGFFDPLGHTLTGQFIITAAALMWVSAALLAQRILRVDI
jgi:tight adherence protein B